VYNAKDENYDVVDYIEVDYSVWFKYVDWGILWHELNFWINLQQI
jgi:hypothetical protein